MKIDYLLNPPTPPTTTTSNNANISNNNLVEKNDKEQSIDEILSKEEFETFIKYLNSSKRFKKLCSLYYRFDEKINKDNIKLNEQIIKKIFCVESPAVEILRHAQTAVCLVIVDYLKQKSKNTISIFEITGVKSEPWSRIVNLKKYRHLNTTIKNNISKKIEELLDANHPLENCFLKLIKYIKDKTPWKVKNNNSRKTDQHTYKHYIKDPQKYPEIFKRSELLKNILNSICETFECINEYGLINYKKLTNIIFDITKIGEDKKINFQENVSGFFKDKRDVTKKNQEIIILFLDESLKINDNPNHMDYELHKKLWGETFKKSCEYLKSMIEINKKDKFMRRNTPTKNKREKGSFSVNEEIIHINAKSELFVKILSLIANTFRCENYASLAEHIFSITSNNSKKAQASFKKNLSQLFNGKRILSVTLKESEKSNEEILMNYLEESKKIKADTVHPKNKLYIMLWKSQWKLPERTFEELLGDLTEKLEKSNTSKEEKKRKTSDKNRTTVSNNNNMEHDTEGELSTEEENPSEKNKKRKTNDINTEISKNTNNNVEDDGNTTNKKERKTDSNRFFSHRPFPPEDHKDDWHNLETPPGEDSPKTM